MHRNAAAARHYYTHVYNDNTIYLRRAGGVCLAMMTTTRTVGRREWVGPVSVRERRWYVWRASGSGWRRVGNTRLNNNVRIIQSSVPVKPSYRRRFYPVIAFRLSYLYILYWRHISRVIFFAVCSYYTIILIYYYHYH